MIKLKNISKAYKGRCIFKSLNLHIPKHCVSVLFSKNGSGKSTLLKIIAGLDSEFTGSREDVNIERLSFVFQDYRKSLFPWYNVEENLFYPLKIKGISKEAFHKRLNYLLEITGFKLELSAKIYELSGGRAQMLAILRALITEPEIVIMDEPFSALDYEVAIFLRKLMRDISIKMQFTLIMVSHDLEEAVFMADRVITIFDHQAITYELNHKSPRELDFILSGSFQEHKKAVLGMLLGGRTLRDFELVNSVG